MVITTPSENSVDETKGHEDDFHEGDDEGMGNAHDDNDEDADTSTR